MATITSLTNLLTAELQRANAKTEVQDTNLHNAITRLIDGYGTSQEPEPPTPGILPDGYKVMAYLEASGRQYIDLNYVPQEQDIISCEMQFTNTGSTYSYLFGTYGPTCSISTKDNRIYVNFGAPNSFQMSASATTKNLILFSTTRIKINGNTVVEFSGDFRPKADTKAYLFTAQGQDRTILSGCKARIYSFYVQRNGRKIINLIPALNSNRILGMYDLVSDKFLTNAGTGYFSAQEA